ncbi:M3 family metallopeptidase, partial [uncultured Abyssibacter sp.]|uniref:M3 family metallopeptidase n=1 Tax=uncultured Abyssibacter sp. TaxID=2320202 RepID=UPI0032B2F793
MNNPLLEMIRGHELPPFSHIRPEHAEPALDAVLDANRAAVRELEQISEPTWDNFVARLERLDNDLHRVFSPVGHLNGVANSPDWRAAYNACRPKLSAYATEMGQNQALYTRFEQIAQSPEFATLSTPRRTIIEHAIRDFRLAGVHLQGEERERYAAIQQQLSVLQTRFQEQVLDATEAWVWNTDDIADLDGLPQRALDAAAAAAKARELTGHAITLDAPSYIAVMTYATDRNLRRTVYEAYATRASDQGPEAGEWDNAPVIQEILDLRQELAALVGYANYAEYSLATKMADSPATVETFLLDLATKARPAAQRELDALAAFAAERGGPTPLAPWDVGFYAEQYREETLGLSDEMLRPYFPAPQVLDGMMAVAEQLYDVRFEPVRDADVWHADVTTYAVLDDAGQRRGLFYVDPYARPGKRGGAWMDDCQGRYRTDDIDQLPIAFLVCNFGGPVDGRPACLSHNEVETLFHEFGHGLHHLLTQVDELSVSGINGVAWDAVELPSQFMENWCWEPEGLALISGHHETGEALPQ